MNINWCGQTCFRIISSRLKNGSVNILIDPIDDGSGLRLPKIDADILILTHDAGSIKGVSSSAFVIDGPGEYDIKEAYIKGIDSSGENKSAIFTIETEEMKICHMGLISQTELSSDQLEKIGEVDVLMVPVGGKRSLDAKSAIKIISQIEPKITIPMYYQIPKLKEKLDSLDVFLKSLGIKSLAPVPKLSIKKKDLSSEEAKIVVLEP
ncbi:MAG: MBL fold metallo-hydrolase [Candidatus Pacebacteria bacterium]|nr:MBL fold metallo-hydrolase [Candidatus Paceibacterota bacterium]